MNTLDWKQLDDYSFVKLVGELFARLGFIDIDFQGEGPDGGIDLFATELLPFAIQGRTPFRWAIQCKFSLKGELSSVNDAEVKDVEGILRSERYQSQQVRGYMLVSNRKIVQNVIERLRGIDRSSQFRTARMDYLQLENVLTEHSELVEKYFGDKGFWKFGKPDVIIPSTAGRAIDEAFSLQVEVGEFTNKVASKKPDKKFRAIIDTGASISVIPNKIVQELNLKPFTHIKVKVAAGEIAIIPQVQVSIWIERIGEFIIVAAVADVETIRLGRDILSGFGMFLRPGGGLDLYATDCPIM